MPHVQGISRETAVVFPSTLDEYITADNPVRFIDAFVDDLDLEALGFARVVSAETGRPAYYPSDLLKLYEFPCTSCGKPASMPSKMPLNSEACGSGRIC